MNKKILIFLSLLLGVFFLYAAAVYFLESAKSLPHFFPGYAATLIKHHYTHGVGALILAFAFFVFAWFQSGKKSS